MFITPCVSYDTCHMSHVTYQVSRVRCHMSGITPKPYKLGSGNLERKFTSSFFSFLIFSSFFGQSVETIWWRVCYQQGRPRLVFKALRVRSVMSFRALKLRSDTPLCFQGYLSPIQSIQSSRYTQTKKMPRIPKSQTVFYQNRLKVGIMKAFLWSSIAIL